MKRMLCLATGLFLLLPAIALAADETGAEEKFDPSEEWTLHPWVSIHIGPIDMSINKAVAYLLLGALCSILLGVFLMRVKTARSRPQAGARRDHLRDRGPGRRAGAAAKAMRTLVLYVRP
jgi:hypothetical protein